MARHKSNTRITAKGTTTVGGVAHDMPQVDGPSPMWVPVLMFGLLALGTILILANYTIEVLGMPSNWYLLGGLGLVLGGIVTATQYR